MKGEERYFKRVHIVYCTIEFGSGGAVGNRFVLYCIREEARKGYGR